MIFIFFSLSAKKDKKQQMTICQKNGKIATFFHKTGTSRATLIGEAAKWRQNDKMTYGSFF